MNYPFLVFTKKLFWPLWVHPKLWVIMIAGALMRWSKSYLSLVIMQYVAKMMESQNYSWFETAFIALIIFYTTFQLLTWIWRHWWRASFRFPFKKVLHQEVFDRYIKLDNTHTEKIWTGKTISIIESGLAAWTDAVMEIISSGINFLFALGFGLYFTAKVSLWYSLIYLLLLVSIMVWVVLINKKVLVYRNMRRDNLRLWTHQAVKIIMSKFEVLLSGKSAHEIQRLDYYMDEAQQRNLKQNNWMYRVFNVPALFIVFLRIGVYFFVWYGYFQWFYSLSEFTAFLGLLIILDTTTGEIVNFYKDLTKNIADITKLREVLDTTPQMLSYTDWADFVYQKGNMSLNNISFAYTEGKPVFENFSLTLQWGKKTALVWLSGSGKTTLMKLIAGYMRADSGELVVDGQNLSQVSLQSYFSHIAYLTQEPSVFDGTIRENLLYWIVENGADRENRDDRVKEVISLAHCDFIYDLPDGLDTEIGERWIRLSWWQRQRLAIAKIFLKNPNIIFLDEPTSALDSLSEKLITDAFHKLFEGRTVIIIAHRLQTVKEADEIIVLWAESWKSKAEGNTTVLLERGTHKQLSVAGWVYQEMLELQSGFNF